ncbi:MAG: hypothetical protein PHI62_01255 [Candidatus Methanomethylophilaceae archaeon]|nr:hypothetical protein [Candidatus Methanomethylophilaceae archaeon]
MSKNQKVGLALAIAGFAVLLLGTAGYIGAYDIGGTVSLVIMGIGTVMIWMSVALIYFVKDIWNKDTQEG